MLDISSDGLSNWVILLQTGDASGGFALPLGLQLAFLIISFLGVVFFTSAEAALIAVNKIRIRRNRDTQRRAWWIGCWASTKSSLRQFC